MGALVVVAVVMLLLFVIGADPRVEADPRDWDDED
jgi:hypothetical protein